MENLTYSSSNSTSFTSASIVNRVGSGFLAICFLLGMPGNIGVVVMILRHFKKENFTLHLMLNLAGSDILFLITLPVWISYWNFDLNLSQTVCKFFFFLIFTSMYCSIMTVTLMSVQRYMMVLYRSQWTKLGRKGEKVLLSCVWILSFILANLSAVKTDTVQEEQMHKCWIVSTSNQETLVFLLFETLLGFVFPLCVIVSSYYCLHKKVNQTTFFSNQRLTKLVTTIVVTFVVIWLPAHLMNIVKIIAIALKPTNPSVSTKLFNFWNLSSNAVNSFTCLNSCVNPFIYACRFRQIFQHHEKPKREGNITQASAV